MYMFVVWDLSAVCKQAYQSLNSLLGLLENVLGRINPQNTPYSYRGILNSTLCNNFS